MWTNTSQSLDFKGFAQLAASAQSRVLSLSWSKMLPVRQTLVVAWRGSAGSTAATGSRRCHFALPGDGVDGGINSGGGRGGVGARTQHRLQLVVAMAAAVDADGATVMVNRNNGGGGSGGNEAGSANPSSSAALKGLIVPLLGISNSACCSGSLGADTLQLVERD